MAKKYLTAVFEYEDEAQFVKGITEAFKDDKAFNDVRVIAVSWEDEISRVEQLDNELAG